MILANLRQIQIVRSTRIIYIIYGRWFNHLLIVEIISDKEMEIFTEL